MKKTPRKEGFLAWLASASATATVLVLRAYVAIDDSIAVLYESFVLDARRLRFRLESSWYMSMSGSLMWLTLVRRPRRQTHASCFGEYDPDEQKF